MTETPAEDDSEEPRPSSDESPLDGNDGGETLSDADATADTSSGEMDMLDARQVAIDGAEQLLDHPVEDVIKVESTDGGWRVVIEVLEREAVPDTQDILGRYEFSIGADGNLSGYELSERYRRDELKEEL
ncbi:MAG: hypothetical protein ACI9YT_001020 [Halobacteriales archaeon]|jgi:hypothetical protein